MINKEKKVAIGVAVGACAVFYALGVVQFDKVLYPNTFINGECYDMDDPLPVSEGLIDNTKSFSIKTLQGTEKIDGEEIGWSTKLSPSIEEIQESQSPWAWPIALFQKHEYSTKEVHSYDKELLSGKIDKLKFMTKSTEFPVDAHIEKTEEGYVLVPESDGDTPIVEKVHEVIAKCLDEDLDKVNLDEEGCYYKAEIRSDNQELLDEYARIDEIQNMVVTIDLTDSAEELDKSVFLDWTSYENGELNFDYDAVDGYVKDLADKYDTWEQSRPFTTHSGAQISVGGGGWDTYGFLMDRETTIDLIKGAIMSGVSQTVSPVWVHTGLTRNTENSDIGSTYVEISIAEQHMWYYENGNLMLDTDVVTGMDIPSRATHPGVFRVRWKETEHTMTGSYGSAFVHYWLPLTEDGIGIHDASWRGSYGGTIYISNGSHGCINTPYSKMQELYNMISAGTPAVIY